MYAEDKIKNSGFIKETEKISIIRTTNDINFDIYKNKREYMGDPYIELLEQYKGIKIQDIKNDLKKFIELFVIKTEFILAEEKEELLLSGTEEVKTYFEEKNLYLNNNKSIKYLNYQFKRREMMERIELKLLISDDVSFEEVI
jgi:hypothetical protein